MAEPFLPIAKHQLSHTQTQTGPVRHHKIPDELKFPTCCCCIKAEPESRENGDSVC